MEKQPHTWLPYVRRNRASARSDCGNADVWQLTLCASGTSQELRGRAGSLLKQQCLYSTDAGTHFCTTSSGLVLSYLAHRLEDEAKVCRTQCKQKRFCSVATLSKDTQDEERAEDQT